MTECTYFHFEYIYYICVIYISHKQINCAEVWNSEKNCKTNTQSLINEHINH